VVQLGHLQKVNQETNALALMQVTFGMLKLDYATAVRVKQWWLLDQKEFV
jgi:hypothetical protein